MMPPFYSLCFLKRPKILVLQTILTIRSLSQGEGGGSNKAKGRLKFFFKFNKRVGFDKSG